MLLELSDEQVVQVNGTTTETWHLSERERDRSTFRQAAYVSATLM